jgi:hypothetical protein
LDEFRKKHDAKMGLKNVRRIIGRLLAFDDMGERKGKDETLFQIYFRRKSVTALEAFFWPRIHS